MNTARALQRNSYFYANQGYAQNPVQQDSPIIEGYFDYKENSVKEMAIRKINSSLSGLLCVTVLVAFVGYYFAMSSEVTLNTLSRQVTTLNDENNDLQNNLDRLKSFNNVDDKMVQYNVLQKAAKVIEVPAVVSQAEIDNNKPEIASAPFNWAIGY